MCLQSWGEGRTRRRQRGAELRVCCGWIPFVRPGLVPGPTNSPGRLRTGLPTSSLSQVHTNHHYHISQAHTNTTSTCPQIHTTQLTGQPPHSSGLQAHTCPYSTHTHTGTHTHFTVWNKHRPCRRWAGVVAGGGRWCFRYGSQN